MKSYNKPHWLPRETQRQVLHTDGSITEYHTTKTWTERQWYNESSMKQSVYRYWNRGLYILPYA